MRPVFVSPCDPRATLYMQPHTAIVIGRAYFAGESKLYSAIQQEKIDKYGGKGVESLDKDL